MRAALAALGLVALVGCFAGCADHPLYGPCEGASDCADPADGCYELRYTRSDGTEARGRTCSVECARDADCPAGGRCLALDGDTTGTFLCFAPCTMAEDCFEGHACTGTTGGDATPICLPQ